MTQKWYTVNSICLPKPEGLVMTYWLFILNNIYNMLLEQKRDFFFHADCYVFICFYGWITRQHTHMHARTRASTRAHTHRFRPIFTQVHYWWCHTGMGGTLIQNTWQQLGYTTPGLTDWLRNLTNVSIQKMPDSPVPRKRTSYRPSTASTWSTAIVVKR